MKKSKKNLTKGVIKTKTERDGIHCFAAKLPALFTKKGDQFKQNVTRKKQRGYSKQINKNQLLLE